MGKWTLFSNHGHVLVCLARDSEARLRDVAADVGITERAVQKIVRDLQDSGMITVSKHGRRNRYRIHRRVTMRHDLEAHCTVGGLLRFVLSKTETGKTLQEQESQAKNPHLEDAGSTEGQTTQSPMMESTAEQQRTAPWSSGSTRVEPGLEKPRVEDSQVERSHVKESQVEKSKAKQSETKQPADAETREVHPIERQQRSLF